jgi:TRAP-type mannitol/chloroaromatic compound transport system permease small subunit
MTSLVNALDKACFWGDLLGTSFFLVEEALVQVLSNFEFVCSSFAFLNLSSLGEPL